jgi:ribosome-associated protein
MIEFKLSGEYIELISLLKYLHIAESGGHAKMMVDEGRVKRNGETEYRRRAKLRQGEIIEVHGQKVQII